jgi:hypothetical protein
MAGENEHTTTQGKAVDPASVLLAAIVTKFEEMSMFCDVLETVAVEETRWHDAATFKSQKLVWRRAMSMAAEVAANAESSDSRP